jgi:hypothetical protein
MNTLRWILSRCGRLTTTMTITPIDDAPIPGTIGPVAADRGREQPAPQERLARIATLLMADTDARLRRIAVLLATAPDGSLAIGMDV